MLNQTAQTRRTQTVSHGLARRCRTTLDQSRARRGSGHWKRGKRHTIEPERGYTERQMVWMDLSSQQQRQRHQRRYAVHDPSRTIRMISKPHQECLQQSASRHFNLSFLHFTIHRKRRRTVLPGLPAHRMIPQLRTNTTLCGSTMHPSLKCKCKCHRTCSTINHNPGTSQNMRMAHNNNTVCRLTGPKAIPTQVRNTSM